MKTTFVILLFCTPGLSQTFFPTVDSKINFTEVVYIDSTTQKELFIRAKMWAATTFRSANSAVQMIDSEAGLLICKGAFAIYHKQMGAVYSGGFVRFTMRVEVKDNRYRYSVTDFFHDPAASRVIAMGSLEDMTTKDYRANGFSLRKQTDQYLEQVFDQTGGVITSLKATMQQSIQDW